MPRGVTCGKYWYTETSGPLGGWVADKFILEELDLCLRPTGAWKQELCTQVIAWLWLLDVLGVSFVYKNT